MNTPAFLVIVLVVALIVIFAYGMVAVAWFRVPRNRSKDRRSPEERSIDELHKRVEALRDRKE